MSRMQTLMTRGCCCLLLALSALGGAAADEPQAFRALDLGATLSPAALGANVADKRVVFVGETHTRYGDHLNQLAIIEQLHARDPNIAIGVEYLQRRFQPQVDDFIAGRATEREFLRDTEYYSSWRYDYRLYAPIFRFAREHHIPVLALNVPPSLPSAVAKAGVEGLSAEQRAALPKQIEPASDAYKAELREAFEAHDEGQRQFDRFVEAQLVWDEGMAESAAEYLSANPGRRMVILAGSGHLAFGYGIPQRLRRRTNASYAIVLNAERGIEPGIADYVLLREDVSLPPAGALGVRLEDAPGGARIAAFGSGSAAKESGLERDDILTVVDGQRIASAADVRVALWDKAPGDRVTVEARRRHRRKDGHVAVVVVLGR
ncbi:MAG TPA: ChaN family lipoprotein [Gammaproteobacteria bacterium]|jgi:uncharacterized iron-regulated protein|nr:ChaN family lipoprotein [Gammaproteobacteria bacterium]